VIAHFINFSGVWFSIKSAPMGHFVNRFGDQIESKWDFVLTASSMAFERGKSTVLGCG
jgi:hypothetical protein